MACMEETTVCLSVHPSECLHDMASLSAACQSDCPYSSVYLSVDPWVLSSSSIHLYLTAHPSVHPSMCNISSISIQSVSLTLLLGTLNWTGSIAAFVSLSALAYSTSLTLHTSLGRNATAYTQRTEIDTKQNTQVTHCYYLLWHGCRERRNIQKIRSFINTHLKCADAVLTLCIDNATWCNELKRLWRKTYSINRCLTIWYMTYDYADDVETEHWAQTDTVSVCEGSTETLTNTLMQQLY